MSAELPKIPEPDHNKALALAILKTPAVDRFVSIEGEPRTVPMFHLSTLLQYGEQVYQEAARQAMEQLVHEYRKGFIDGQLDMRDRALLPQDPDHLAGVGNMVDGKDQSEERHG